MLAVEFGRIRNAADADAYICSTLDELEDPLRLFDKAYLSGRLAEVDSLFVYYPEIPRTGEYRWRVSEIEKRQGLSA